MTSYPNPARVYFGRFYVTKCRQSAGAPVIDTGSSRSVDGWSGGCWVIRLRRTAGPALVLGRIGWRAQYPARLARIPLLGRLFRPRLA